MKRLILYMAACMAAVCAAAAGPVRVSILGDSYSTFLGCVEPAGNEVWYFPDDPAEKTDVTSRDKTWWDIFVRENGMVLERNNSWSGATICNRGYNGEDYSRRSFINRVTDLGRPDLILVFGATNDYWAGVALTPETAGAAEPHAMYTFAPAADYLMQQLRALYPDAEVVFMLNDIIDGPVREVLLGVCRARGIACLELKDISKRMGHPDAQGMRAIAEQLSAFLAARGRE